MSTDGSPAKRKVLFTTGIRSEYDILYSVIKAVDLHPKAEVVLVVTGAHLSTMYGHTVDEISKDGFRIVSCIESLLNSDTKAARAKSAAIQLAGLVDALSQVRPDVMVAMGDREEALTVAIAGAYMGIPVAHIGGGDWADDGNVDNPVRYAASRLAHIHFASSEQGAKRLIKMGEEPWRVHVAGAPGLDRLLNVETVSGNALSQELGFDVTKGPIALVIQHPISTESDEAGKQMRVTLESITEHGLRAIVSYPNSDAGSHGIIEVIEEFAELSSDLHVYRNLPRKIFVNLLRSVDMLIGNSSCGIIEAPMLKLPVVNVGRRQVGREHAENVIFVEHDLPQIRGAIDRALHDKEFRKQLQECQNPYGDGHAGQRIADILANVEIDQRLLGKRFIC